MQGSSESSTGPQTSHLARAAHTSHNKAFCCRAEHIRRGYKVFGQEALLDVLYLNVKCHDNQEVRVSAVI